MSALADRVREGLARAPGSNQASLARACGVSQPSVNNWLSGKTKTMKAETLRKAAAYLGCDPYWLSTGEGDPNWRKSQHSNAGPANRLVAHDVSHPETIVLPITLEWGATLNITDHQQFILAAPDSALQPRFAPGTRFIFDRNRKPDAGDVVLVRDQDGHHYIREYHLARAGLWIAAASNDAYEPMRSDELGLEVSAVAIGALWT